MSAIYHYMNDKKGEIEQTLEAALRGPTEININALQSWGRLAEYLRQDGYRVRVRLELEPDIPKTAQKSGGGTQ